MDDNKSKNISTRRPIVNARTVAKCFCLFVVAYGILISPWPGLDRVYALFYREALVFLSGSLAGDSSVRFERSTDPKYDVNIVFYDKNRLEADGKPTAVGFFGQNCRRDAYVFVAFTIALILATPLSWKRKGLALAWAMIAVHIFIAFKLGIWTLYGLNREPFNVFARSRVLTGMVFIIKEICVRNMNFGLILCALVWIVVSLRGAIRREPGAGTR